MMDSYKKAMDRIKTDDEYKSQFLQLAKQKAAVKKSIIRPPFVSYIATAAAVALVFYCTALFFIKQPENATITHEQSISLRNTQPRSNSNVVYFTFDGFDKYNIDLQSKAVLVSNYDEDYTLANLLSDYYSVIADKDSDVVINDGMVDNFLNIQADNSKQINIYINGREVLNLEQELVSNCLESETDVYFKVSVVE